ncbi:MAG: hypothetical protein CM15mP22_7340 [Gammaproteobacteria bacterium]|nr:MAG: hypothetical protein CM15mP22_7340 [Gammaproteobacteria bacterium]
MGIPLRGVESLTSTNPQCGKHKEWQKKPVNYLLSKNQKGKKFFFFAQKSARLKSKYIRKSGYLS